MGGGSSAAATGEASTTTTTAVPGPVVALEPTTLTIEGGSIIKVGLSLQLPGGEEGAAGHGEAAAEGGTTGYNRVLDIAYDVYGSRTDDELASSEGREAAKAELVEKVRAAYHDEIEDVFITQFVLQRT